MHAISSVQLKPLIIVGAPRSGTNALRDTICSLSHFSTWPCDEINYIWRYGNSDYPTDCIPVDNITPSISEYIRGEFLKRLARFSQEDMPHILVEKTCANCLRLPFVSSLFPDAKYIYIQRDPYDVVASSLKRWTAKLDIPYLLKKARYVPKSELSKYFFKYIKSRFHLYSSSFKSLKTWGPRFPGIDKVRQDSSLEYLCAYQWSFCCLYAKEFLARPDISYVSTTYESFSRNPSAVLNSVLNQLGYTVNLSSVEEVCNKIHSRSIGNGLLSLSQYQIDEINSAIQQSESDVLSLFPD